MQVQWPSLSLKYHKQDIKNFETHSSIQNKSMATTLTGRGGGGGDHIRADTCLKKDF